VGVYNLKSLGALLGPGREVTTVSATARSVSVTSRFEPWTALRLERGPSGHHVHDRTRPAEEQ
jgi:hypothetical protein